jgi:hypothetical protein
MNERAAPILTYPPRERLLLLLELAQQATAAAVAMPSDAPENGLLARIDQAIVILAEARRQLTDAALLVEPAAPRVQIA